MQSRCTSLALHPHLDLLNNDHDNFKDLEHYYAGDDVDNLSLGNSPPSLFISARNRCAHLEVLSFLLLCSPVFSLFLLSLSFFVCLLLSYRLQWMSSKSPKEYFLCYRKVLNMSRKLDEDTFLSLSTRRTAIWELIF